MESCYSHLSAVERKEISRGMAAGRPIRSIARRLGRSPSTVSRELRRNADRPEGYLATAAQWRAQRRARVPRRRRKLADRWLRRYVGRHLRDGWSPQQIAARLRRDYPADMRKRISHETIYAAIYIVPRGELRRTLIGCLRQHRKVRRGRRRSGQKSGQAIDRLLHFLEFIKACPRAGTDWLDAFAHFCRKGIKSEHCRDCIRLAAEKAQVLRIEE